MNTATPTKIAQELNSPDQLRLITRVASLYHERGLSQAEIADQLGLSQARVSRVLKLAEAQGIVQITVHVPDGVHAKLEEKLESSYQLDEVIVVESNQGPLRSSEAFNQISAATIASYMELVIPSFESIGVSSWSSTLLAAVNRIRPMRPGDTKSIVQVLGGVGVANSQISATRLTERLAHMSKAEPVFLLAPGLVANVTAKNTLIADSICQETLLRFDQLAALFMGVGALPPSKLLRENGNVFSDNDVNELKIAGAVGDVCMRFFDADGKHVSSPFDDRVIGITDQQILQTRRRVGVAGGPQKFDAIRAALRGGWLSTLVTDLQTAKKLIINP